MPHAAYPHAAYLESYLYTSHTYIVWVYSTVGHNIRLKEEIIESDSVLVYIPIIYYRAHIYIYTVTYSTRYGS